MSKTRIVPEPIDLNTKTFVPVKILRDEGKFVIAENADGDIAMRWHPRDGSLGYPNGFGKPQWFLMPDGTKYSKAQLTLRTGSEEKRWETILKDAKTHENLSHVVREMELKGHNKIVMNSREDVRGAKLVTRLLWPGEAVVIYISDMKEPFAHTFFCFEISKTREVDIDVVANTYALFGNIESDVIEFLAWSLLEYMGGASCFLQTDPSLEHTTAS